MSTTEEQKEVIVGSPEREIHVKPLVTLEKVKTENEESNESQIYKMRAKLYRYFLDKEDGPTWKERGVGDVKILKHNATGLYRILMRRDKTLKLCANHAITSSMELKPHSSSDRAFVWSTPSDLADGEAKPETLCIKFGKPESAAEFRQKFEECVTSSKNATNLKSSNDEDKIEKDTSDEKLAEDLSALKVNGDVKVNTEQEDDSKTEGNKNKEENKENNDSKKENDNKEDGEKTNNE